MQLATSMTRLGTETAFEVLVRARALEAQGRNIIHLEIGEPDFDTPAHIREAAKKAIDEGWTHYGPSQGLPELREAIANDVAVSRSIPVSADHVVVTPGGKPIIFFPMLALLESGRRGHLSEPRLPHLRVDDQLPRRVPVPMPLFEERGFSFDLDRLRDRLTDRTRLIDPQLSAEPHRRRHSAEDDLPRCPNWCGTATSWYSPTKSTRACATAQAAGFHHHLPGMLEKTIILDGFSKTYSMTGWRIGYGVMPHVAGGRGQQADGQLKLLHRELHPTRRHRRVERPAAEVERMVAEFRAAATPSARRLNHVARLPLRSAGGAFYAFPNIRGDRLQFQANWPTACSTRPASPASAALPSANSAKATSASATPTRSKT